MRVGDWKLLWLCEPSGTGDWELYDTRNDPGKMNDRATAHPDIRDQMAGHRDEYASANTVILPDTSAVCQSPKQG